LEGKENCFWKKDMLGGCGSVEIVVWEQEAGGQQAQVGSLRAGLSGEPKNSKGRVSGLRRRWNALLCVLVFSLVDVYCWARLPWEESENEDREED
jgi:hypothetical protein